MALKDSFTAEEWSQVLQAPMLAALAITAADPGGLWGAVKEGAAMARSLLAAKGDGSELTSEIVAAFETSEGRSAARDGVKAMLAGKKPAAAAQAAVERLGGIAGIVAAKAPGEATAFKAWLRQIAENVAEAGTEGGFLGFGGEQVSAAERQTLADLDTALA
jgi:hypothetical protein